MNGADNHKVLSEVLLEAVRVDLDVAGVVGPIESENATTE